MDSTLLVNSVSNIYCMFLFIGKNGKRKIKEKNFAEIAIETRR